VTSERTLLSVLCDLDEAAAAAVVRFRDGDTYLVRVVSTLHTEEGGDIVADVLEVLAAPTGRALPAGVCMNFLLADVAEVTVAGKRVFPAPASEAEPSAAADPASSVVPRVQLPVAGPLSFIVRRGGVKWRFDKMAATGTAMGLPMYGTTLSCTPGRTMSPSTTGSRPSATAGTRSLKSIVMMRRVASSAAVSTAAPNMNFWLVRTPMRKALYLLWARRNWPRFASEIPTSLIASAKETSSRLSV